MTTKKEIYAVLDSIKRKSGQVRSEDFRRQAERQAEIEWLEFAMATAIPRDCYAARLDGKKTPMLEAVRAYMLNQAGAGKYVALSGPTGIGKTFAAVAALRAWEGNSRRFLYVPTLCRELQRFETRTAAMERALYVRFLVLDDVGAGATAVTDRLGGDVDEILTYREAKHRPTIMTTNLKPDVFLVLFSDRIRDRLEGPWGKIFATTGKSLRRKSA